MGIVDFLFSTRHLIVVCTQTCIFRCCIVFEEVVCRLYEMLYPCICNVVIWCWKSGAYGIVICRGGTDMCFVPGSGWKHLDLEQYHISGLTTTPFIFYGSINYAGDKTTSKTHKKQNTKVKRNSKSYITQGFKV